MFVASAEHRKALGLRLYWLYSHRKLRTPHIRVQLPPFYQPRISLSISVKRYPDTDGAVPPHTHTHTPHLQHYVCYNFPKQTVTFPHINRLITVI